MRRERGQAMTVSYGCIKQAWERASTSPYGTWLAIGALVKGEEPGLLESITCLFFIF